MNIGIIGLGLIGGSLGRAIIKNTNNVVYGYDVNAQTLLKGEMINAYHNVLSCDEYEKLDILIIAVFSRACINVMNEVCSKLKSGCVVMDIAGNKRNITNRMKDLSLKFSELNFVGTHPMAGKEYSGINHSTSSLFEKASMLLVPVKCDLELLSSIKQLFLNIGFMRVLITDAKEHDRIIAYTSQLAHLISCCYVKSPTAEEHDGFSAGSFKDLTRVARLSPLMWGELMVDNKDNLLNELDIFINNLNEIKSSLLNNDQSKLELLLEDGNTKKEIIDKATRVWKKKNE